jgi:hypothetical protein
MDCGRLKSSAGKRAKKFRSVLVFRFSRNWDCPEDLRQEAISPGIEAPNRPQFQHVDEGENNPALRGGLDGKKTPATGEGFIRPFAGVSISRNSQLAFRLRGISGGTQCGRCSLACERYRQSDVPNQPSPSALDQRERFHRYR